MNFEKKLNKLLYNLFTKKNFNYIFGLLLIILFIIILYNKNNLIEGNTSTILGSINRNLQNNLNTSTNQINNAKKNINNQNSTTNSVVLQNTETFIENMSCSDNDYSNFDNNNSASKLVNNACLQAKRLKQENNV